MLLGYVRVSTAEQVEGSSPEAQEKIIRGYAMAKGFTQFDTAVYFDDGVSASIPLRNRPSGKRLLEDAKPGDTIIAAKLDRMFRSARDALNMVEIFQERGLNLVLFDFGTDPINSSGLAQFFFTVIAGVAQLERAMIRERFTGGKKAKKLKGGHIGGSAPYGWRVVGQKKKAWLEPIEEEQKVLVWIKERADLGLAEIKRQLDEEGLMSRSGKPFFKMQVARIVEQVQKNGAL